VCVEGVDDGVEDGLGEGRRVGEVLLGVVGRLLDQLLALQQLPLITLLT